MLPVCSFWRTGQCGAEHKTNYEPHLFFNLSRFYNYWQESHLLWRSNRVNPWQGACLTVLSSVISVGPPEQNQATFTAYQSGTMIRKYALAWTTLTPISLQFRSVHTITQTCRLMCFWRLSHWAGNYYGAYGKHSSSRKTCFRWFITMPLSDNIFVHILGILMNRGAQIHGY